MHRERGFTLIELLVVIAIIGILASIGIGHFESYRQKAYDADAVSDLRNAATAEEAYYIDPDSYVSCANVAACLAVLSSLKNVSPTVALAVTGTTSSFTGTAVAAAGTGTVYTWDSDNGGLQ